MFVLMMMFLSTSVSAIEWCNASMTHQFIYDLNASSRFNVSYPLAFVINETSFDYDKCGNSQSFRFYYDNCTQIDQFLELFDRKGNSYWHLNITDDENNLTLYCNDSVETATLKSDFDAVFGTNFSTLHTFTKNGSDLRNGTFISATGATLLV